MLELSRVGRDTQVAAVRGAVALHEARGLEGAIVAEIGQGRKRVVVDLAEVTDVGPGLLGVLLRVRRGVTRVDGSLALVVAGPPVADLIATTLLAALIPVADDRARALMLVGDHGAGGSATAPGPLASA